MHTHTHIQNGRHRMLVAAPLFVFFLALSIREGVVRQTTMHGDLFANGQTLTAAQDTPKTVVAGDEVLRIEPGSQVDVSSPTMPVLLQGTVLVASRTLSHLQAGSMLLQGWNGGFQVTVTGEDITIAALTTPVLVTAGERQTLVPAMMQWKSGILVPLSDGIASWYQSREPKLLPVSFTQDQLQTMRSLESMLSVAAPLMESSLLPPTFGQELMLESARERADSAARSERLDAIGQALIHELDELNALLLQDDTQELFASAEGQDAMPILLSLAVSGGKMDLFLPFFVTQHDRLLLALFHPLVRSHAWLLPVSATLSDDELLSALLLTVLSDGGPEAMDDLAIQQWGAAWSQYVQTQNDPESVLGGALQIVARHIERLDHLHYPRRVDSYASTILSFAEPVQQSLSAEAVSALDFLRSLRDNRRTAAPLADLLAVAPVIAVSSSSVSSAKPVETIAPEILMEQARSALLQAGFMETSQTVLKPVSGLVHVANIVLGTPKGDTVLYFTFDPVRNQVSGIEKNGKVLPYAITLQQYIDWVNSL